MAVNEHTVVRIQELLARTRDVTTGGTLGVTSWFVASELGVTVNTARRWLRALVRAQRVEVRDDPLSPNGHLYRLTRR